MAIRNSIESVVEPGLPPFPMEAPFSGWIVGGVSSRTVERGSKPSDANSAKIRSRAVLI